MANETKEQRKKRVIEMVKEGKDYLPMHWAYVAEQDIDFLEAYATLYNRGLTDGKALPAKVRELVVIGVLAFRQRENGAYDHMKRALRLGATKQEIVEAIESAMIPGGGPTFLTGMQALMRIVEEEEKAKAK